MTEIIVENEHYTLSYHPETGVVHNRFHKYTFGEPFRQCLDDGRKLFIARRAHKWLSDDRENSAVPPEDRSWVQQIWVPRIAKAGWKYWAIVLPKSVVGKMNLEWFAKEIGVPELTVRMFDDPDDALTWIVEQP